MTKEKESRWTLKYTHRHGEDEDDYATRELAEKGACLKIVEWWRDIDSFDAQTAIAAKLSVRDWAGAIEVWDSYQTDQELQSRERECFYIEERQPPRQSVDVPDPEVPEIVECSSTSISLALPDPQTQGAFVCLSFSTKSLALEYIMAWYPSPRASILLPLLTVTTSVVFRIHAGHGVDYAVCTSCMNSQERAQVIERETVGWVGVIDCNRCQTLFWSEGLGVRGSTA